MQKVDNKCGKKKDNGSRNRQRFEQSRIGIKRITSADNQRVPMMATEGSISQVKKGGQF